jgi:hypothetical protein
VSVLLHSQAPKLKRNKAHLSTVTADRIYRTRFAEFRFNNRVEMPGVLSGLSDVDVPTRMKRGRRLSSLP